MVDHPVLAPPGLVHPVLVHVDNVVKDFQGPAGVINVLKRVNLSVTAGEFVGVRGPSGSGKSTLINMITGIDRQIGRAHV